MAVRWVPAAVVRPHRCAFIPFLGSHHPRGFFDFGTEIMAFDGHVYCSVVAAEQMAQAMGWAPSGDVVQANGRALEQAERITELETELGELKAQLEAVEVLKNTGFKQTRPPGRPKTKAGV